MRSATAVQRNGCGFSLQAFDATANGALEMANTAKRSASHSLVGDFDKESFDLIRAGGTRRREVNVISGTAGVPALHSIGFLRECIVHHDVNPDVIVLGNRFIRFIHEAKEFPGTMPSETLADDPDCRRIQCGEPTRGPVAGRRAADCHICDLQAE